MPRFSETSSEGRADLAGANECNIHGSFLSSSTTVESNGSCLDPCRLLFEPKILDDLARQGAFEKTGGHHDARPRDGALGESASTVPAKGAFILGRGSIPPNVLFTFPSNGPLFTCKQSERIAMQFLTIATVADDDTDTFARHGHAYTTTVACADDFVLGRTHDAPFSWMEFGV